LEQYGANRVGVDDVIQEFSDPMGKVPPQRKAKDEPHMWVVAEWRLRVKTRPKIKRYVRSSVGEAKGMCI
jgi:hypothetical protein